MTAEEPDIVAVAPARAAVEWGEVRFSEIPGFQRAARARIAAALARQGVDAGAAVTFSRAPSGEAIAIAPGSLVAGGVRPDGAVTVQEIPAGRAAHCRLAGPYARLPEAWGRLAAWVAGRGLVPAGLNWEVYTDPAGPVTDLYALLAEG